ncbi:MAG: SpoIIE family protein phosphatase [Lachnospiraceae bacterium]|nr:SpoIIE family protein phosphatase [Lachnospiraceae bacterium]
MKKRTLGRKIIRGMIALAVVLIAGTSASVGRHFDKQVRKNYESLLYSATGTIASYVEGYLLPYYLEMGEEDAYYWEIQEFLTSLRGQSYIESLYIVVPREDGIVYIWESCDRPEEEQSLGGIEEYTSETRRITADLMAGENLPHEMRTVRSKDIYTGYTPIMDEDGIVYGIAGADISTRVLLKDFLLELVDVSMHIILVLMSFMVIYYLVMRRDVVNPIGKLYLATDKLVNSLGSGKETFQVDIRTGDEIEELAHAFEKMDDELRDYIAKISSVTAERERIGTELNVAAQIQAGMLPTEFPAFPERTEFDLYASMTPAKEVGGDFYDFFLIDDDRLALVMADVSGKGVPASLVMSVAKALIKNQVLMGVDPAEALSNVNDQLCSDDEEEMFVTVWLGILTISTGRIICANAGHEYPAIGRDGAFTLIKTKHGPPIGIYEEITYQTEELTLDHGDLLFLYTDGLPEATNAYREMFGEEGMVKALSDAYGASPRELLERVRETANHFVGEAEPFDDMTMLAFLYK